MTGQIEIWMIGQIDRGWCRRWSREFHQKCIIIRELIGNGCNHRTRIPTKVVRIQMGHHDAITLLIGRPIEFVETDVATVQMMQIVPILVNVVLFAIELEFTAIDAIAHTANGRAKIRITIRLETYQINIRFFFTLFVFFSVS